MVNVGARGRVATTAAYIKFTNIYDGWVVGCIAQHHKPNLTYLVGWVAVNFKMCEELFITILT